MSDFIRKILTVPKCRCCFKPAAGNLCESCGLQLAACRMKEGKIPDADCPPLVDAAYGSYYYKGAAAQSVIKAKFSNPARFLSSFLQDISVDINTILVQNEIDMVRSVPCHKSKLYTRETDLPRQMAKVIGRRFKVPVYHGLKKIKKTEIQHSLPLAKRKTNLQGAFLAQTDIAGKNLLLIDDVMTSGSTLSRCAQRLVQAGCGKITAWVYAYNTYMEE